MTLRPGQIVGDYRVEAELGGGGMATVYRVRHTVLDTTHALKVLAPEYRVNAEARQRFLEEAKIQAKYLDHPGIVKVTGIVATSEVAALVMELVEGESLEAYIEKRRAPASLAEIRALMVPILDAIGHAHAAGIIHRDIKPANVLLAGGTRPRLTDFGIAKVGDRVAKKLTTQIAAKMGTLGYMSPEQIRHAKHVTARSDIFALGAMLYELATGTQAFPGDSEYDVMHAVVNGTYRRPEDVVRGIDPGVAAVIRRALDPDPDRRFGSAAEMSAALRGELGAPAAAPVALPPLAPDDATSRGSRTVWLILPAVAALAVAAVAVYLLARPSAPRVSDAVLASLEGGEASGANVEPAPYARRPAKGRYVRARIGQSPVIGPPDAAVTVVWIIDYAESGSKRSVDTVEALRARYGTDLRVVVKFQPYTGRPGSVHATHLAWLAHRKDAFWRYHHAAMKSLYLRPSDAHFDAVFLGAGFHESDRLFFKSGFEEQQRADERFYLLAVIPAAPQLIINGELAPSLADADEIAKRQLAEARAVRAERSVPATELYDYLIDAIP